MLKIKFIQKYLKIKNYRNKIKHLKFEFLKNKEKDSILQKTTLCR